MTQHPHPLLQKAPAAAVPPAQPPASPARRWLRGAGTVPCRDLGSFPSACLLAPGDPRSPFGLLSRGRGSRRRREANAYQGARLVGVRSWFLRRGSLPARVPAGRSGLSVTSVPALPGRRASGPGLRGCLRSRWPRRCRRAVAVGCPAPVPPAPACCVSGTSTLSESGREFLPPRKVRQLKGAWEAGAG